MSYALVLLNSCCDRRVFLIPPGQRVQMGRRHDLDARVEDFTVARCHAEVWEEAGVLHVKDCNSRNGVWVQRVRLPSGVAVPLQPWDVFFLATVPIRVVPPATIDPGWLAWRDGTVLRLAEGIRCRRDFESLPVLADALEEAGCTETRILNHCRYPAVERTFSSWVVDLLCMEGGNGH